MDLSRFEVVGPIARVQVIAVNRRIRELQNLRKLFGPGRWRKLKGIGNGPLSQRFDIPRRTALVRGARDRPA